MLIDDVTIHVTAGNGGNGVAAFNSNMKSLGPVGGSGGHGGSVYLEGVSDIGRLAQFRHKKNWSAKDGKAGRGQFMDGNRGEDLILYVPTGTVIHNKDTGNVHEIIKQGDRVLVAQGGKGGRGNFHFRGPTNTSPEEFEKGTNAEEFTLRLELKLIADVGLIGLPNVGKSSLLNELTNAKSKVANYQFTTLEPNLGAYYGLILADIPGLIEGASNGKGLGIKFLRHIERTRVLLHCIAADSPHPFEDYKTIRKELGDYSKKLLDKPVYILITKTDLVSADQAEETMKSLKSIKRDILPVSIHDMDSLKALGKILQSLLK
ncbi:MAG: GTPase ObgE [Patescibacteria group bacterium]